MRSRWWAPLVICCALPACRSGERSHFAGTDPVPLDRPLEEILVDGSGAFCVDAIQREVRVYHVADVKCAGVTAAMAEDGGADAASLEVVAGSRPPLVGAILFAAPDPSFLAVAVSPGGVDPVVTDGGSAPRALSPIGRVRVGVLDVYIWTLEATPGRQTVTLVVDGRSVGVVWLGSPFVGARGFEPADSKVVTIGTVP